MSLVLSINFAKRLHFLLTFLVLIIGTIVMVGWILENPAIIQIHPEMAPMVFNTAFCFVILAFGFLFSEGKNRIIPRGAALTVFLISTITILEYFLGIDLGIDRFFIEPFYAVGASTLGRMSVSTSVCFLMLSILTYFNRSGYFYRLLCVTGSSLVIGFSLIGGSGYLIGFNSEYGWGSFSRMAVHTALSFILFALAYLWQIRLRVRESSKQRDALIPFYVVIIGILTSMLIWQLLLFRDQERNRRMVQIRAEGIKVSLDNAFLPLQKALEHMARRFSSGSYINEKMWLVDAESYFAEFEGLRRLIWVDQDHFARWVYPLSNGGEKLIRLNLAERDIEVSEGLKKASEGNTPILSRFFELKTGGRGFVLLAPVFRDGKYLGAISAALIADSFFSRVVELEGYDLAILENGVEIYKQGASDPVFARDWKMKTSYTALGVNWDIVLVPSASIVRENTSALPGVVLVFGVGISVLLGLALSFYIRSRESERVAKEAFELKEAGMNSVPLLIISLDKNSLIREMNATAEKVLEYSSDEVAGKATPVIFHDALEIQNLQDQHEKAGGEGSVSGGEYAEAFFKLDLNKASEWVQLSKSGKRHIMVMSLNKIRDDAGNITGYLQVLEDVTLLREKEMLLKEQEQKILTSARLASLGEMAAGIAHEINNPLAIINGHVAVVRKNLAQKGLYEDVELGKRFDAIETVVHRIAKIIRGLRSYARESDLRGQETVKLESVIDETMAFCLERFRTEGVEVSVDVEPGLTVHVRPYQLSQVLLNLLNNALDAVQGSKVKKVKVEGRRREGGVEISVSDTGPGVPYNLRNKIMEPFFTTKEVGKGVGLGLSISQGIIQSHNGKFYLDDKSAKTRFVIWLPGESKDSKPSPL